MVLLTECNLAQLAVEFQNGKTVIFPTETSYGLGCDATNQKAVDRIYDIKDRSKTKSLLVAVPSVEEAKKYLVWNELLEKLATKYWPGPLTVVGTYTGHAGLANGVVSAENTVAVRVSQYPFLRSITSMLGKPVVATSGNVANAGDIYSADVIVDMFKDRPVQPDFVLDYGTLLVNKPTTIVSVVGGELKVLRQGEVVIEL